MNIERIRKDLEELKKILSETGDEDTVIKIDVALSCLNIEEMLERITLAMYSLERLPAYANKKVEFLAKKILENMSKDWYEAE